MSNYITTAMANLGPFSEEQESFTGMMKEWRATGDVQDLDSLEGTCGVCDHTELRYLFTIENRRTGHQLESGSVCILRFDEIAVVTDEGEVYDQDRKHAALLRSISKLKKEASQEKQQEWTDEIWKMLPQIPLERRPAKGLEVFERAVRKVRGAVDRGDKVWPRDFSTFLWAASRAGIALPVSVFKGVINLRGRGVDDLLRMKTEAFWRYEGLLPALTPSQLRTLERHAAPPPRVAPSARPPANPWSGKW